MDKIRQIANFLFELNEAKRTPRNGWHKAGVKNSESVAEHSALAAQFAFILAKMENANAEHAAAIALFHDIGEIRAGDHDLISKIYHDKNGAEEKAHNAQTGDLPLAGDLVGYFNERKGRQSPEAVIAKDADLLELAVQARVYEQSGYRSAGLFLKDARAGLKTGSAQKLLNVIEQSNIQDWWQAIPEIATIAGKVFDKKNN